MERKGKVLIVLIVFLASVLGTVVYGQFLKTPEEKKESKVDVLKLSDYQEVEKKELDINEDLVRNLNYPKVNFIDKLSVITYFYQNNTVNDISRDLKMFSAAYDLKSNEIEDNSEEYHNLMEKLIASGVKNEQAGGSFNVISGKELRDNFKKIFGPDEEYKDGSLNLFSCGNIYYYLAEDDQYLLPTSCGASGARFENEVKTYKAVLEGDDTLYVYKYVQPFVNTEFYPMYKESGVFLYKREILDYEKNLDNNETEIINYDEKIFPDEKTNVINQKMSAGEVDTYKFTFKKQSDGKFYFYSGNWEKNSENNKLTYPDVNIINNLGYADFSYKDFDVDSIDKDYLMLSAAHNIKVDNKSDDLGIYLIDANTVERNFKNIFGPDKPYKNGRLEISGCNSISDYSQMNRVYLVNANCGAQGYYMKYVTVFDKTEVKDDYLYTYFYVQPYIEPNETIQNEYYKDKAYFYKRPIDNFLNDKYEPVNYTKEVDNSLKEITVNEMIKSNQVDKYKFTFKKQSDGNYYIQSGNWIKS